MGASPSRKCSACRFALDAAQCFESAAETVPVAADIGARLMTELPAHILDRQFDATAPDRKWVADFTDII